MLKKILIKILKIAYNNIYRHNKIVNPTIGMTLLVKNEEDIIEDNIRFHKKMGIDFIIVTDNNSTDNTSDILVKLKNEGLINDIILELNDGYQQDLWVDRMVNILIKNYNPSWIINSDADEFWFSDDIKQYLSKTTKNVIYVNSSNILPFENNERYFDNTYRVVKFINDNKYHLPKYNLLSKTLPKVIHRSEGYKKIHIGNHDVDIIKKCSCASNRIQIYHFALRSIEHFKRKMINGGQEIEKNTINGNPNNTGAHWLYYYHAWKNNIFKLEEIYFDFIGKSIFDSLLKEGVIINDVKLKEVLSQIRSEQN